MGGDQQLRFVVKNSFIHVLDTDEPSTPPTRNRPRAVSDGTGIRTNCEVFTQDMITQEPRSRSMPESASLIATTDLAVQLANLTMIDPAVDNRTTVMMKNIPNSYSSSSLVQLFDNQGFQSKYDFIYLPIDFHTGVNLGYAFVNLVENDDAQRFMVRFNGFCQWMRETPKVCEVLWTFPQQGLADHIDRYRNSPVMHESVSDEYKPRLYLHGVRVSFPEPTKRIRAPRTRPQKRPLCPSKRR